MPLVFPFPMLRWLPVLVGIAVWSRWSQARKAKAEKTASDLALRWFEKPVADLTADELVYLREAIAEQQRYG